MAGNDIDLIVIDSFCGSGGTTQGFHSATIDGKRCAMVFVGINHDANAILSHASNHPETQHFTEDFTTFNPQNLTEIVESAKSTFPDALVLFWMSAECTNHSRAKGGANRDPDSRSLPEYIYGYIEALRPDIIVVENVMEFTDWGPLVAKVRNGKTVLVPDPDHKGEYYRAWLMKIKSFGYYYDRRFMNAANYGAYTSRTRYFGIFSTSPDLLVFPDPTHSKSGKDGLEKWKAVKDVLDFSDAGESIFNRKKPLVENTLDRILAGLVKFVAGGKTKWLLKYNSVNENTGKHIPPDADDPCPVVSCQGRLGVVQCFLGQRNSGNPGSKICDVDCPSRTITTTAGNLELVQCFLSKYFSGHPESKNIDVSCPAHTIKPIDNHSFISCYCGHNHSTEDPNPTLTTKDRCAFVTAYYGGSGHNYDAGKPCPSLTTKDRCGLVNRYFVNYYSGGGGVSKIDDPCPAVMPNPKQNLITPVNFLVNPQYDSKGGSVDRPCFTLIARMDKMPPSLLTADSETRILPDFIKSCGRVFVYEIYDTDSLKTRQIKEFMAIYGIVDIKMRMLRIPELLRIMGFGDGYVLRGTQTEQKKFIGNAVECTQSRAIAEAFAMAVRKHRKTKTT
jgi:DNA (cytosine-5)-methyltransferase 1